jgi:uncharacterized delta-60 repeat protein
MRSGVVEAETNRSWETVVGSDGADHAPDRLRIVPTNPSSHFLHPIVPMIRRLVALLIASIGLPFTDPVSAQSPGSADPGFNVASLVNGSVEVVVPLPDGKMYIGGSFTTVRGAVRRNVARLNADGTVDSSFDPGTGGNSSVYALAVQSDGKVLVGGYFTNFAGTNYKMLVRLNTDGSRHSRAE